MGAIEALTAAIELVKSLKDAKLSDAKVKDQMADLYLKLADLKMEMANLINENLDLKKKLSEAQENNEKRGEIKKMGLFYFQINEKGKDGPFCPGCYDGNNKLIHLKPMPSQFSRLATHQCPVCKTTYK